MTLSYLIAPLKRKIPKEYENVEISKICENSKESDSSSIFVAINGNKLDGSQFILDAKGRGVRVAITENRNFKTDNMLIIYVKNARKTLAVLSARLEGNPEKKMKIVGITGTKGKSTTAFFLYEILRRFSRKSIFIGSFGIMSERLIKTDNTTPSPTLIFKELRRALDRGIELAIIEVSSQALKDFRLHGIRFSYVAFTSLGNDHVGKYEHKSRADYISAKHSLFSSYGARVAVVNGDDPYASFIASGTPKIIKCGFSRTNDFLIENFLENSSGSKFSLLECEINLTMHGKYNATNLLIAILLAALILKKFVPEISKMASGISVMGRFEEYFVSGRHVVIDYAHTPESFHAVSQIAKKLYSGRQIAVFGSVYDRGFSRRITLAHAAEKLFDFSVISGDDVSGDGALDVCLEIYSNFEDKSCVTVVPDRKKAIERAFLLSTPGDTLLLLGKGQEKSIIKNGKEEYFNEREIIFELAMRDDLKKEL
jgi:UDP-N-acetylmuramoyl-L-alanyl-D-glutamate--2,6-diaminopimelate ligase